MLFPEWVRRVIGCQPHRLSELRRPGNQVRRQIAARHRARALQYRKFCETKGMSDRGRLLPGALEPRGPDWQEKEQMFTLDLVSQVGLCLPSAGNAAGDSCTLNFKFSAIASQLTLGSADGVLSNVIPNGRRRFVGVGVAPGGGEPSLGVPSAMCPTTDDDLPLGVTRVGSASGG